MNVIAFTKVSLPYGWLGNMAPYFVEYEGKRYRTSEALFQCLRFDEHPEVQEIIRVQTSPMAAKMIRQSTATCSIAPRETKRKTTSRACAAASC